MHLEALGIRRRIDGGAGPDQIEQLCNLGVVTRQQGRLTEARDYYRQALDVIASFYPEGYSDDYYILNGLGLVYRDLGEPAQALEYLRESGRKIAERFGDEHPNLAFSYANQGEMLVDLGEYEAAVGVLEESLAIFVSAMPGHRAVHRVKVQLGKARANLEQWEQAEHTLLEAYVQTAAASPEIARAALEELIGLYELWKKPEEVVAYRERLTNLVLKPY